MYAKISICLAGFCIVFVQVKVAEKPDKIESQVLEPNVCIDNVSSTCFKNLTSLYGNCSSMKGLDENNALTKLEKESCEGPFQTNSSDMCKALDVAKKKCLQVKGLLTAECRAVTMYTTRKFHKDYNPDIRNGNWTPYKVFTTLLYCALLKLNKTESNLPKATLYRGLKITLVVPKSGGFYFGQFTSTTSNKSKAEEFGTKTFIYFDDVPILAPKILDLSKYSDEQEYLISPFEAFEFVKQNGNELHLKSAKKQGILNKNRSDLCASVQAPQMVSGVVVVHLLLIKAFAVYLIVQ